MNELKVGVIGLGMGKHHVRSLQASPFAEVVAVADADQKMLELAQVELKVPNAYLSGEEMLSRESLDVVCVAAPNKFHKPLTLAALAAGCHVACEKPMAMNAVEAKEMLDAARAAEKRLMINFSFRFTDQSFAMKREVDAGTLGEVYFARSWWLRRRGMPRFGGWFGCKNLSGGGPLIDLGVHRLDLALWLMGYPKPRWVLAGTYDKLASEQARKENKKFDVEDFAAAMIKFENGAILELEASWAGNIKERELMETRLLGTKGGMLQRNLDEGYSFEAEIFLERDGCQYDLKLHPPVPEAQNSMRHFIDAIVHDQPHIATGEEGLVVMELLDAIYASAEKGEPVRVEEPQLKIDSDQASVPSEESRAPETA